MKLLALFAAFSLWAADAELKVGREMVTEAQALIKTGVPVIDVRQEACDGYVRGATLISVDDILSKSPTAIKKMEELTKGNKATKIAFYCRSGGRAGKAANVYKELGYTNVVNLGGVGNYYDAESMVKCTK